MFHDQGYQVWYGFQPFSLSRNPLNPIFMALSWLIFVIGLKVTYQNDQGTKSYQTG